MRIYIHTDLEGISGIGRAEMVPRDSEDYAYSCELLMGDLNAAVDGAFAGGAKEVLVLDSHGGGGNFILKLLDSRAQVDTKPNKKWWGIMDERCDATYFIGAHAMAGTMNAFLEHTQSSASWYDYSINGRSMGELGQWALVAGHFGVPLVMMSGDEAACVEARQFFRPCMTACVKTARERQRADCVPLDEARQRIWQAAHDAIEIISQAKPFCPQKPFEMVTKFMRTDYDEILHPKATRHGSLGFRMTPGAKRPENSSVVSRDTDARRSPVLTYASSVYSEAVRPWLFAIAR